MNGEGDGDMRRMNSGLGRRDAGFMWHQRHLIDLGAREVCEIKRRLSQKRAEDGDFIVPNGRWPACEVANRSRCEEGAVGEKEWW